MRTLYLLVTFLLLALPALSETSEHQKVSALLDGLHQAASEADGERYFDLFAPDGVFLGTDITERWTIDEFKAYAMPFFRQGRGWTYRPRERHIYFAGDVAWFDETLQSENYGETRGSGVLTRIQGEWKINQYHLTVPIPNALLNQVVEMIRQRPSE